MKKMFLIATIAALSGFSALADDAVKTQLKDGTSIEILSGAVSIVSADGSKAPAPDGIHELADGTKVTIKDGKVVKE